MRRFHMHPCCLCQTPVECLGQLESNYDGVPAVTCQAYHLSAGHVQRVVCGSCTRDQTPQMYWTFTDGEWWLKLCDRPLGAVSPNGFGYWAAATVLDGLTTGGGELEWAKHELWSFCERRYCR